MEDAEIVKNMEAYTPVWRKIVEYIPAKKRFEIALLNKFFYNLVCAIDANRYILRINSRNMADDAILASKRKYDAVKFRIDPYFDEIKIMYMTEILRAHGSNIEKLSIDEDFFEINSAKISARRWIAFFQQVPRLKHLDLAFSEFNFQSWYELPAVLEHIETLKIDEYILNMTNGFTSMFLENTIKCLEIYRSGKEWKQNEFFYKQQSKIAELDIHWDHALNVDAFKNLHLKSFTLSSASEDQIDSICKLITDHPELEKLQIYKTTLQGLATVICNSLSLEEIYLDFSHSNVHELLNGLVNLRNLKKVGIEFCNRNDDISILETISTFRLPTVEHIEIIYHSPRQVYLNFEEAALNWPKLKCLKNCNYTLGCNEDNENNANAINEYFENFMNLEKLTIQGKIRETIFFLSNGQQFPNMKELDIKYFHKLEYLSDLLKALPNLKNLKITTETIIPFTPTLFSDLLNMKQLSELEIGIDFDINFRGATPYSLSLCHSLCHRLKKFTIYFSGSVKFMDSLVEGTQGWDFVEKKFGRIQRLNIIERTLELSSFKY